MQSALGGKDEMDGVAVDSDGNVIMGGPFQYTVDFNGTKRTAKNGIDIWLSKLSPDGKELWFTSIDSGGDDFMWDLEADPSGDILISGGYGGSLTVNGKTHDAHRDGSALFAKIDGDTGAFVWLQTAGVVTAGTEPVDSERVAGGNEIKVDSAGNAIAILSASGSEYQVGDMTFKRAGVMDSFIVKISPAGEFIWAYQFLGGGRKQARAVGITGTDEIAFGYQLIGEIATTEGFTFTTRTDRTPQGVAGLLSEDGKLEWMYPVESAGFANVRGAGGDSAGDVYFTGVITGQASVGDTATASVGDASAFLTKYTREGEQAWVRMLGDTVSSDAGGELVVSDDIIAISGGNTGAHYSVFDAGGAVLAQDVHTVENRISRATWTIFNPAGAVIGAYAPTYSDASNGGVLEYAGAGCFIFQYAFYGKVSFANGDSYTSTNQRDPKKPDKDIGIVKSCFAF
jgi:hypothetical protein